MPTYNKLIRNKIPQIIKANGKTPTTRILPKDEYIEELCKKTQEELSDLLELINALAEHEGTTLEEINNIRKRKQKNEAASQIESF